KAVPARGKGSPNVARSYAGPWRGSREPPWKPPRGGPGPASGCGTEARARRTVADQTQELGVAPVPEALVGKIDVPGTGVPVHGARGRKIEGSHDLHQDRDGEGQGE